MRKRLAKLSVVTSYVLAAATALCVTVTVAPASADTFVAVPTGGDDTASIQAAFDAAVAAGSGHVVELSSGVFHVSAPIIVRGFAGSFVGAGQDATIVEVEGDPVFPITMVVADPAYPLDPKKSIRGPFTFIEIEGGRPTTW